MGQHPIRTQIPLTVLSTGRSFRANRPRSRKGNDHGKAKSCKTKSQLFVLTRPSAQTVLSHAGDFTGWDQAPVALKKDKTGVWKKTIPLPPGRYEYRLLVDGQWHNDPECSLRKPNQFGGENCVCVVSETPL